MVKQFDIIFIDLNPIKGKEKGKVRPVLVVSNELINKGTGFVWVMPITNRPKKYPMDIEVKSIMNKVNGIIDTIQIRCVDYKVRNGRVVDHLEESLYKQVINTIEVFNEIDNKDID